MEDGRKKDDKETYFSYPRSQKRSDDKFEAFEFCLYDDEVEVRRGVHGSRHVFHGFDLLLQKRFGQCYSAVCLNDGFSAFGCEWFMMCAFPGLLLSLSSHFEHMRKLDLAFA